MTLFAQLADVNLAYRILNADSPALPLVLIMGWTGVKEDWGRLADDLAADRPVLIFDNRGIGESSVPDGPYSVEQLAADTLALAGHVGWQRFHVLGVSMGGMIAQALALAHPLRIERLVLGCTQHGGVGLVSPSEKVLGALQMTPGRPPRDVVRDFLWINYTEAWVAANAEQYEAYVDFSLQYKRSRRGMMHQMAAIFSFDVQDRVHTLPQPTLVVHGTGDVLIPFANGEMLARKIPHAQFLVLKGSGHAFWHTHSDLSSTGIREFLGIH